MRTSSLTRTPPLSRAAFQFKPHSFRLIFPVRLNPALRLPQGSLPTPPGSTSSFMGLVISLMVRLPLRVKFSSSTCSSEVDSNFKSGQIGYLTPVSDSETCQSRADSSLLKSFAGSLFSTGLPFVLPGPSGPIYSPPRRSGCVAA